MKLEALLRVSAILLSPDPVRTLNCDVGRAISRIVPTKALLRSRDKVRFDGNSRTAYDAKRTAYWAGVVHVVQIFGTHYVLPLLLKMSMPRIL